MWLPLAPPSAVEAVIVVEAECSDRWLGIEMVTPLSMTVAEVMTPVVVTLAEDALITEAAQIMIEKRIHRIPVVSESGRVVGIVSAVDLLGPMATRTPSDRTA